MAPLNFCNKVQSKAQVGEQDPDEPVIEDVDIDLKELYFLILHFLAIGPCQRTFGQFLNELLEHHLLPRRYHAWYSRSGMPSGHVNDDGISFPLTYDKLVERHPHIQKDHLVKLLKQLMLNVAPSLSSMGRSVPNAADVPTLLGAGCFSLLETDRTEVNKQAKPPAHLHWPHMQADQVHGLNLREIGGGFTKHHRAPSIRYACYAVAKPSAMVRKMQNIKRLRGHRAAVYCAIFDRSGRYVITGSDDRLVKIWSMETAFCLASCRGHEGDITDLAVSSNNMVVASASNDYSIRVWHLPDGRPISVLRGHIGAVTAIAFNPRPGFQLLSSSDDGTCRIWDARNPESNPRVFRPKPVDAVTVAGNNNDLSSIFLPSSSTGPRCHQILCCAYNASGTLFVTGSSDTFARVWNACKSNTDAFEQPIHEIDVLAGHENDVNYVQFSGCAVAPKFSSSDPFTEDNRKKFKNSWFRHDNIVTCSRDGSAIIWIPSVRRSHGKAGRWMQAYHLKVPPPPMPPQAPRGGPRQRLLPTPRGVNMIIWSLDNRFVLAAIMDCRICVWNASDGSLLHCLTGHTESTYVLDVHPFNPRIAMSAGYDGKTIVWDIWEGTPIKTYEIGRFKLVDGKFSQDGTSIVLSDEVGQIYLLNTGQGESQKDAKYDQFFLGDYRPLTQDTLGNVLDQETQLVPYRRNIQDRLCDGSMIPYPEPYQSMYQKRRLSALGIEWRPSSIKFAIGTDIGLGQEILPLADLDTVFEPLPDFVDAMYWEPDIEALNDDTDSEYNVTDEFPSENERGSLSSYFSDSECIEEDYRNGQIRSGLRRSKRKKRKAEVELMTSSGRRIKRRNLDEHGGSLSRSRRTKQKNANRFSKRRLSKAKSLKPQRVARYSQITEASTDEEDEICSEDNSSESELEQQDSTLQNNGTVYNSLILQAKHLNGRETCTDGAHDAVKPPEPIGFQTNNGSQRKLVLKFLLRDSKKSFSSENAVYNGDRQADLVPSSPRPNQETSRENKVNPDSDIPESSSTNSINFMLSGDCNRTDYIDGEDPEKVDSHLNAPASHKRIKIRWGKGEARNLNGHNINRNNVESCMDTESNHGISSQEQEIQHYGSKLPGEGYKDEELLRTCTIDDITRPQSEDLPTSDLLLCHSVSLDGHQQASNASASDGSLVTKHKYSAALDAGRAPELVANAHDSNELEDNPPKPTKLRIKLKSRNPGSPSKLNFRISADALNHFANDLESKSSQGMENNHASRMDFPRAASDAIHRPKSMGLEETSRDTDAATHIFKVRNGLKLSGNSRKVEKLSKRAFDLPSDECMKSSKMSLRSRSCQHGGGVHYGDDQSPLVGSKSHYPESKANWLTLSEHEGCSYIPQLGDKVVYLRQGHQDYIERSHSSYVGPWVRIKKQIRAVEICLVESLDYATLPGSGDSCCKITLKFIDPSSCICGEIFKLTLSELLGFPDFVVEKTWYDAAIRRNWTCRDRCLVFWKDHREVGIWCEGRIVSCQDKSMEFPGSPWERYSIVYKGYSETYFHSPWELRDPESPWVHPHIDHETRDRLLSCFNYLQATVSRNQDFYGILKLRNVATKLDYINGFAAPLSLNLIELRLRNNYYRTLEAVKHDIMVALLNARSYFRKDSRLAAKLRSLSEWFTEFLSDL